MAGAGAGICLELKPEPEISKMATLVTIFVMFLTTVRLKFELNDLGSEQGP